MGDAARHNGLLGLIFASILAFGIVRPLVRRSNPIEPSKTTRESSGFRIEPGKKACESGEFGVGEVVFKLHGRVIHQLEGELADYFKANWKSIGMLYADKPPREAKSTSGVTYNLYSFEKGVLVCESGCQPYFLAWSLVGEWSRNNRIIGTPARPPGRAGSLHNSTTLFTSTLCWG